MDAISFNKGIILFRKSYHQKYAIFYFICECNVGDSTKTIYFELFHRYYDAYQKSLDDIASELLHW